MLKQFHKERQTLRLRLSNLPEKSFGMSTVVNVRHRQVGLTIAIETAHGHGKRVRSGTVSWCDPERDRRNGPGEGDGN
jgi:hypothetical protein